MAGFYGKLPSKGDFITRGLQRSVVDQLHTFFNTGLQESKVVIGSKWLDEYAIAPIWHFYIGAGVLNDQHWLGVWMPSVDRVNRSFPIILLDTIEQPLHSADDFNSYVDWLTECENLVLDVIHEDIEFDEFCSKVVNKSCYQKYHSADDIDAIFEDVKSKEEQPTAKEINLDHLNPSTPFEKAVMAKIGMLEHILKKVCKQQNLDYNQTVEQYISSLTDEQKDSSQISPVSTFGYNLNLAHSMHVLSSDDTPDLSKHVIWSSDGNETVSRQFVVHEKLPDAETFHKFLQGF